MFTFIPLISICFLRYSVNQWKWKGALKDMPTGTQTLSSLTHSCFLCIDQWLQKSKARVIIPVKFPWKWSSHIMSTFSHVHVVHQIKLLPTHPSKVLFLVVYLSISFPLLQLFLDPHLLPYSFNFVSFLFKPPRPICAAQMFLDM